MKNSILLLLSYLWLLASAQTVFWSENFNNGCLEGCFANAYVGPNGAWSVNNAGGPNGGAPNQWFVSCAENNTGVGNCSAACGTNATLHVGANPSSFCTCWVCFGLNGDCGAAYDACSFNLCAGSSPATSRRAFSPNINTVGQTGITLSFVYIENGEGSADNATVQYSADGGATWVNLVDPAKTTVCGSSGQGVWTSLSIALPAACENITNLRIGFVWNNNINGVGADPSFAVDDVQLSVGSPLPTLFANFTVKNEHDKNFIYWQNHGNKRGKYFIERSSNGEDFYTIAAFENDETYYVYLDENPYNGTNFYRLHLQDKDGNHYYSRIESVEIHGLHRFEISQISYQAQTLSYFVNAAEATPYVLKLYDMTGKVILNLYHQAQPGAHQYSHECGALAKGIYQAVFISQKGIEYKKLYVQ
ncbi:MAG: hypothetical protein NZ519_00925 [Bacteroidia bacterium]|nr:hypothetical protein [Bacteroidia bacterium]